MHILVIGATGPSGIAFVEAALKSNHKLTLYVRTPAKVPIEIQQHGDLDIIQGTFDDDVALGSALNSGATVYWCRSQGRWPVVVRTSPSLASTRTSSSQLFAKLLDQGSDVC